jgi:NADH:ubiquinone oxidoreductase subunit F (NADH-binding)/(2Fe-2S) ferredoxin
MRIGSIEELERIKHQYIEADKEYKYTAYICYGAGCMSSECMSVKEAFVKALDEHQLSSKVKVNLTGCMGSCAMGPTIIIDPDKVLYCKVTPDDASRIVTKHLIESKIVENLCYKNKEDNTIIPHLNDIEFFERQQKIVLRNCGLIDFSSLNEYIAHDGYFALAKALKKMTPLSVIDEIKKAGLRGRGGGGYPTGLKWEMANKSKSKQKYIICNADEGDPGAFMDRSVLEGDPHSVLEGMIIAAYAIEATQGVIYCRAEYPLAIKRLNIALIQARDKGYLGKNIFGIEGFDFDIYIKEGAGAFVCGEETALIASVEGERGMPRKRPPFPAASGLWKKPTNINNVETFANIPWIILNGAAAFAAYGTEKSKGTKVFALAGKVSHSGLVEVPMGMTIRDVIFKLGGGIKKDKKFKAVQMGGPSGGCIPEYLADTIVDYDSVNATGAIMGSGGMVVMDETTCMVDVAKFFLDFTRKESCGKCTFCRMGTMRMLEILERITDGKV